MCQVTRVFEEAMNEDTVSIEYVYTGHGGTNMAGGNRAMTECERLKAWLDRVFGSRVVSQSVTVEDGVAVIEEDVDMSPEVEILLGDMYKKLGLRRAPWMIENPQWG